MGQETDCVIILKTIVGEGGRGWRVKWGEGGGGELTGIWGTKWKREGTNWPTGKHAKKVENTRKCSLEDKKSRNSREVSEEAERCGCVLWRCSHGVKLALVPNCPQSSNGSCHCPENASYPAPPIYVCTCGSVLCMCLCVKFEVTLPRAMVRILWSPLDSSPYQLWGSMITTIEIPLFSSSHHRVHIRHHVTLPSYLKQILENTKKTTTTKTRESCDQWQTVIITLYHMKALMKYLW